MQLIPVDVEGQPDQYLILVATRLIRCIDEQASRIRLWTHENGIPDMVGKYASVRDMRIDKAKVEGAQVFLPLSQWRAPGWQPSAGAPARAGGVGPRVRQRQFGPVARAPTSDRLSARVTAIVDGSQLGPVE